MGNEMSKRNDENSYYTRVVDNAIRSATPSISGDSHVRSFGSLIDSAIRSSTASTTDADFDLSFHNLKIFSYSELKEATRNFRPDTSLGEGRFGVVFKGWIDENSLAPCRPGIGMAVAVKRIHYNCRFRGDGGWLADINYLRQLQHPNLVRLIGYGLEDKYYYRILVEEFMPKGSMGNHLFRRGSYFQPLTWSLRMKIALGAAKGLAFLHSTEPKVIYRNFKTSNILLDTNYNAKLSDFGLERDAADYRDCLLDHLYIPRVVCPECGYNEAYEATEYLAPEFAATDDLTLVTNKSDVYSFGVVLLEMISGRRALDMKRPTGEHNLVDWAKPYLCDKRRVLRVMDPLLEGQYSVHRQALAAAAVLAWQCLAVDRERRPNMDEVVKALQQLQEPNDMH